MVYGLWESQAAHAQWHSEQYIHGCSANWESREEIFWVLGLLEAPESVDSPDRERLSAFWGSGMHGETGSGS